MLGLLPQLRLYSTGLWSSNCVRFHKPCSAL